MTWLVTGTEKTPVDTLGIANVSLLLHGNADGSGNILDSSPSPKTVSKFGNAASATPPSYPNSNSAFGSAIAFDGDGDYLSIQGSNAFKITGSTQFTIELFVYRNATGDQHLLGYNNNVTTNPLYFWDIGIGQDNVNTNKILLRYRRVGGTDSKLVGTTSINTGQWYHIAISRDSSTIRLFVNGLLESSVVDTVDTNVPDTGLLGIGANLYGGAFFQYFNGYIDELRITKSIARYTADFNRPTAPFPDI